MKSAKCQDSVFARRTKLSQEWFKLHLPDFPRGAKLALYPLDLNYMGYAEWYSYKVKIVLSFTQGF